MNTRSISGAAKVICARMGRPNAVGATIAVALDAGGWLNTEDTAAELVALRARVAELEAAAKVSRTEAIADVGDWLEEIDDKNAAYMVRTFDIPAARDMRPAENPQRAEAAGRPCGCPDRFDRHAVGCPTLPGEGAAARRSVDVQFPIVAADGTP
ncbi:hypothetical protein ACODT5_15390 [Streptomyces sp. 5.8]|uniref:hypothetical protein n=1 Tax=Streptomyces sp. 5.8 TaxID=3406571 RepID=UPI003BB781E8